MPNPKDLDLLSRSLSADWPSRIDFFKKFIFENTSIRRMAAGYRDTEEFLHDVFTNVLRSGHSYDADRDVSDWVESVAAWTALERKRFREREGTEVRVSAAVEVDEPEFRSRLSGYAPPAKSPVDSLTNSLAAIAGQAQLAMIAQRARDDSNWEQIATAAGKPLNTIGPLIVRGVDRLARCFGAPPPLNADLESVFSLSQERSSSHDASGRIGPMRLDPVFYGLTPELRKIGLTMPAEVRTIRLWDTARSSKPPAADLRDHMVQCGYCADVLRAMLLMQQALNSGTAAPFRLCPSGFTLHTGHEDASYPPLQEHLQSCELCRKETDALFTHDEQSSAAKPRRAGGQRTKLYAIAAVVILAIAGGLLYYSRTHSSGQNDSASASNSRDAIPIRQVAIDARYSDLAQGVSILDKHWQESIRPQNIDFFNHLVTLFRAGEVPIALVNASPIGEYDPAVELLYGVGMFMQKDMPACYHAMLKSEAMAPRNAFRCWVTMQSALMVGDLKVAEREAGHLEKDPEFGKQAKDLLQKAKARAAGS